MAGAGRKLLNRVVFPVADALVAWIDHVDNGLPTHRLIAAGYLKLLRPEVSAYICAKVVIDRLRSRAKLVQTAMEIASRIEDEVKLAEFEKEYPSLYTWLLQSRQASHSWSYKHKVFRAHMKLRDFRRDPWPHSDKLHIGCKLIDLLIESTGIVYLEMASERSRSGRGRPSTPYIIYPTEEWVRWLESTDAYDEWLSPVFSPMLERPGKRTNPWDGGYRYIRTPLVKGATKTYQQELASQPMPQVYAALNALQETPWAVNEAVLAVADAIWQVGELPIGIMPPRHETPLPPKPADIDTNADARRQWRGAAARVHRENHALLSKRINVQLILAQARQLQGQAFYYPVQLDFRGRTYYCASAFSPQGTDLARGLLTFHEGKPLTDEGVDWLAIHGANCFGFDKVSFEDRIQWVGEHESDICQVASDPFECRWWMEADEPWQFLAFCFEWARFMRDGSGMVCRLPVSQDGSCNGLQNLSALLRDEVGGAAVNLVPSEKPRDLYTEVLERLVSRLRYMAMASPRDHADRGLANGWLNSGLLTRKLVKRPAMTYAYSVTPYGVRDQLISEIAKSRHEWEQSSPFGEDDRQGWKACDWLAPLLLDCIGQVVIAAAKVMAWLQEMAMLAAKEGLPIQWQTPLGFPVQQRYLRYKRRYVKTRISGTVMKLIISNEGGKLDRVRQRMGVAPNVVHSLDASHLYLTLAKAAEAQVSAFGAVHDSYWTLPSDAPVVARALREAFVEMYEGCDPLWDLYLSIEAMLRDPSVLSPPPEKGNLRLQQVLESPYFFA
jgi:Autographiviridae RNA polymerase